MTEEKRNYCADSEPDKTRTYLIGDIEFKVNSFFSKDGRSLEKTIESLVLRESQQQDNIPA